MSGKNYLHLSHVLSSNPSTITALFFFFCTAETNNTTNNDWDVPQCTSQSGHKWSKLIKINLELFNKSKDTFQTPPVASKTCAWLMRKKKKKGLAYSYHIMETTMRWCLLYCFLAKCYECNPGICASIWTDTEELMFRILN